MKKRKQIGQTHEKHHQDQEVKIMLELSILVIGGGFRTEGKRKREKRNANLTNDERNLDEHDLAPERTEIDPEFSDE